MTLHKAFQSLTSLVQLKDYLMHTLGMKKCMLVKMGWMCEETCQLIPDKIQECFDMSPVADHFCVEDPVAKCMHLGSLMTCENMEEFVGKLEEMDMDYFKDLAMADMAGAEDMPRGDLGMNFQYSYTATCNILI